MGSIELVIEGRARGVGSITVARILPSPRRRMVGPFTFLDMMGPVDIAPGVGFDVAPHPHIGLSTVTYFLEGENVHRDSIGTVQKNVPGDLNLMTAGRGVVHSERADPAFRARGGRMHGLQIWLAVPTEREDDEPSFQHHPQRTLPSVEPSDGTCARVLLGDAYGVRSPATHPSAPLLVDLELAAGASVELPDALERAVFVITGSLALEDATLPALQLAVLAPGPISVRATEATRFVVLGGAPLGPRFMDWNFVSSDRDKLVRARDAWIARTFPTIPGDDTEHVPYPGQHG